MKKEKDYLIPLLIGLFIWACLVSCNVTKPVVIEGKISHIEGRKVTVNGNTFRLINNDSVWVGKYVTFTGTTRNDKRINSKRSN